MITIRISWTASETEGVTYNIYLIEDGEETLLTNTGNLQYDYSMDEEVDCVFHIRALLSGVESDALRIIYISQPTRLDIAKIRVMIQDETSPCAFSDNEIFLKRLDSIKETEEGTRCATAIVLLEALLADSAKRFDYKQGQSEIKASQIFNHIEKLIERYKKNLATAEKTDIPRVASRLHPAYDSEVETEPDLSRDDLGL